jgi:hypothetical protein
MSLSITTPPAIASSAAAQKVFDIPELLENILKLGESGISGAK